MRRFLFITLIAVTLTACEEVKKYVESISSSENTEGLKEALKVGAGNAATNLGKENGYLGDMAVKILLPEEAQTTFKAIKAISGNEVINTAIKALGGIDLKSDFENILVTAINRSAEDAAPKAVDIFVNAITNMTITDAASLLFTNNHTAATQYLSDKTYGSLQTTFGDVINTSLSNVEVSGYTALEAWSFFAEQNNSLAELISDPTVQTAISAASLLGLNKDIVTTIKSVKEVNTNLGAYTTGKALDGLFLKVGNEEEKIRTDVNARTSELLKRVFGQLD